MFQFFKRLKDIWGNQFWIYWIYYQDLHPGSNTTYTIHCIEITPKQYRNIYVPASLGQRVRFYFSFIQLDLSVPKEDPQRILKQLTKKPQSWYAQLLKLYLQPPFHLSQVKNVLTNPHGKNHALVETRSMRLAV